MNQDYQTLLMNAKVCMYEYRRCRKHFYLVDAIHFTRLCLMMRRNAWN